MMMMIMICTEARAVHCHHHIRANCQHAINLFDLTLGIINRFVSQSAPLYSIPFQKIDVIQLIQNHPLNSPNTCFHTRNLKMLFMGPGFDTKGTDG